MTQEEAKAPHRLELYPMWDVSPQEIEEYKQEIDEAGEECNVLWPLETRTVDEYIKYTKADEHELVSAFFIDGEMIGVCRVTPTPRHEENGTVGIHIRPRARGNGYAQLMISMLMLQCRMDGVTNLTAMIATENHASKRSFIKAGWHETGRTVKWTFPIEKEAVEFVPNS